MRMLQPFRLLVLFLLLAVNTLAQASPTLVGTRYVASSNLVVAPGQIVRLQVTGLSTVLPSPAVQKATSVPLPTSLAGISVTVRQFFRLSLHDTPQPLEPHKAPLLMVNQIDSCSSSFSPACLITYITAQIPYELGVIGGSLYYSTEIVISENNLDSKPFFVSAVYDQMHVVTACDREDIQAAGCAAIVTHADGSQVSAQSPATPGEVVVVYAWGLGNTSPPVTTGELTPTPAPVSSIPGYPFGVAVRLDFAPNAAPSFLYENPPSLTAMPYLTPGQIGLYQINVKLPSSFPPVPACTTSEAIGYLGIVSNLTINLRGPYSHDGAAICVRPTQ
jgi:hypothetical protein